MTATKRRSVIPPRPISNDISQLLYCVVVPFSPFEPFNLFGRGGEIILIEGGPRILALIFPLTVSLLCSSLNYTAHLCRAKTK